jgi:hypothetical protein
VGCWGKGKKEALLTYSDILRRLLHPLQLILIHDYTEFATVTASPCLDGTQGAALRLWTVGKQDEMEGLAWD